MTASAAGTKAPELSDNLRGMQLPHIGVLTREHLEEVIALGEWFRDNRYDMTYSDLLKGRVQGLLFVYESTRTRLGFEAAMAQLGGTTVYMAVKDTQMGRGESMADIQCTICERFFGRTRPAVAVCLSCASGFCEEHGLRGDEGGACLFCADEFAGRLDALADDAA